MYDVPVVLFVYRRPDLTRRVLEQLGALRPRKLLVVADAPRDPGEQPACDAVRALFARLPWSTELATDFAAEHLGCGRRVASGLDWVFRQVERAVILEDDLLPHPSFFGFCRELLERYAADERVMQIGGCNLLGRVESPFSYGFSRFSIPPWGWASWARAWKHYDFRIAGWDAARAHLERWLGRTYPLWNELVQGYRTRLGSWDLQWSAALWCRGGVSVVPTCNLVSNLGYGPEGTFTCFDASPFSRMPVFEMPHELLHPPTREPSFDERLEPAVMAWIREIMTREQQRKLRRRAG